MSTLELLIAARPLIDDVDHWCGGTLAKDRAGRATDPCSPDAHQRCIEGAMCAVLGINDDRLPSTETELALAAIADSQGWQIFDEKRAATAVRDWQDSLAHGDGKSWGHKTMLAALDRTIADIRGRKVAA